MFSTWNMAETRLYSAYDDACILVRKRKSRKGGSHSTLSLLRKELREENLQSFLGGSSCTVSSNSAPDPLLSSFILPMVDDFVNVQPNYSRETRTTKKSPDVNKSER
ncbi:DEHYDRATION-INDUCED 19-like protein 3-like [Gossypium australe]|uniref:DEHYDRATION-INDUCED 19-like protein 3-like n=1 Tax=Gossypium australe TaxID=47621 RepID=A0A5B6XAG8_9ROSI|nr:DEHYDRATION-INDUCED 19-like protein 3-like [Gossypium australe]